MTDFDRLYERVDKTSDNLDRLTVQVTGLAAVVQNHDIRLKQIEEQPQQNAMNLRGNLGLIFAGAGGCLIPGLVAFGGLLYFIVSHLPR